jgi:tetratricopeptide (TPR) repeat protein
MAKRLSGRPMASADELELDSRASGSGTTGADVLVSAVAADAAKSDPTVATLAARLIEAQTAVARLQQEKLREEMATQQDEQRLMLSHLRVRRFGDYSRMALEIFIGLIVLMMLLGLAGMVFNATQAHELVFDELGVPPDIAAQGITGKALSARLLDEFSRIVGGTTSISQDAETFRSGTGGNVRIAIPNTGISLGELDQYLRDWLGNEKHVSGDLVHASQGLALTARLGQSPGTTFAGSAQDLAALINSAAETLYAQALPLRYADYLEQNGRYAEAVTVLRPLSQYGTALQRAQALASWSELLGATGDLRGSHDLALAAVHLAPNVLYTQWVLCDAEWALGHEQSEVDCDDAVIRVGRNMSHSVTTDTANGWRYDEAFKLELIGDYAGAVETIDRFSAAVQAATPGYDSLIMFMRVDDSAREHDQGSASIGLAALPDIVWSFPPHLGSAWATTIIDTDKQDWHAAVADGQMAVALARDAKGVGIPIIAGIPSGILPMLSTAYAHVGDFTRAESLIAPTALDCDSCVRARGRIAALRHDWQRAEKWFTMVDARSPSIPTAATEWGEMLLRKGDLDGAIMKFEEAHRKSPRFADPLEMWGETLMQENRSDLSLTKFEEADRYAPNWGRLHLKWGEALAYSGHVDQARAQFSIAGGLYLTEADRARLARDTH